MPKYECISAVLIFEAKRPLLLVILGVEQTREWMNGALVSVTAADVQMPDVDPTESFVVTAVTDNQAFYPSIPGKRTLWVVNAQGLGRRQVSTATFVPAWNCDAVLWLNVADPEAMLEGLRRATGPTASYRSTETRTSFN